MLISLILYWLWGLTGSWTSGLFCWKIVGPSPKKIKMDREDYSNHEQPSEQDLENLSQDIVSFWKPLGRKLKVPNVKLEQIQGDNIQYPGIKEKAFQMLLAWIEQGKTATFGHLSVALQSLGKNRLADKYCGSSWVHFMTVIKKCWSSSQNVQNNIVFCQCLLFFILFYQKGV